MSTPFQEFTLEGWIRYMRDESIIWRAYADGHPDKVEFSPEWRDEMYRLMVQFKDLLPMSFSNPVYGFTEGWLEGLGLQPFYGDDPFNPMVQPLSHPLVHVGLPFTLSELTAGVWDCQSLSAHLERPLLVDTFEPIPVPSISLDAYKAVLTVRDREEIVMSAGTPVNYFLWLNSPITELKDDFDVYLASLTKKRRYKVKQALATVGTEENPAISVSTGSRFGEGLLSDQVNSILATFEDPVDIECMLLQLLFGVATCNTHPHLVDLVCADHQLGIFIRRNGHTMNFLYNRDPDNRADSGINLLTQYVRHLHMNRPEGVMYVDPTCRYRPDEDSMNTYKRVITNENRYHPMPFVSADPAHIEGVITPAFIAGHWQMSASNGPANPEMME
ncbi:hypothetical protein Voja6_00195 [Pseudomonas phage vB_PpuM-Voja-6]